MLLCVMAPHQWTVPTLGGGQDASLGDFMPRHALDICGDESVLTSVGFRVKLARQIAEILRTFSKLLWGLCSLQSAFSNCSFRESVMSFPMLGFESNGSLKMPGLAKCDSEPQRS